MSNAKHTPGPRSKCRACSDERTATYAQGRADERAAIVRWLRALPFRPMLTVEDVADEIERGEHER